MRINRQEFLTRLEAVQAGLSAREVVEQSSCFVFKNQTVYTFNDRLLCAQPCPIDFEGAVAAKSLLALLGKLPDEEIDVRAGKGEMRILGPGRSAGIRMEDEIKLPIDSVEIPEEWGSIHEDFAEGVKLVCDCTGKDENKFIYTCVHVHPDHLEACDNLQAIRYPVATGVQNATVIPGDALRHIIGLDMTSIAETPTWLHFENPAGLRLSIKRYTEAYPDLAAKALVLDNGEKFTLPGSLAEVVARCEIFSAETERNEILVELQDGKLRISGTGTSGYFREVKKVTYDGTPTAFLIAPGVLGELVKLSSECEIGAKKLRVDTGRFIYVSCVTAPENVDSAAPGA